MKVKILESSGWYKHFVGSEFEVDEYDRNHTRLPFKISGMGWVYESDCVITELPESFCVQRCEDRKKLEKYIKWLNKTYGCEYNGNFWDYYGYIQEYGFDSSNHPFGTEIHIDDILKHIDYMKSQQHIKGGEQFSKESQLIAKMNKEFDLTTNEGRLAYARQNYPIGTKYIPLYSTGKSWEEHNNIKTVNYNIELLENGGIEGGPGFIYASGRWAEIIKEETNMKTQKLSRQGLKEIHSIACSSWKLTLEGWGSRNPLEDYIELSQKEIDIMFNASDDNQKSILSKYLKQDDWSVDVKHCYISPNHIIGVRVFGKYENKSFYLSNEFNWEIKGDEYNQLCLIPTKKK